MTADGVLIVTMLAAIAATLTAIAIYYYDIKREQERRK